MRVAIYLRVSTKGQGEDDKLGIPTQEAAVDRFCRQHGHEVVGRYADIGFSGATADRPDLARLLADASTGGFEALVVYKGDRLARDTMLDGYLRFTLKRHNVAVLSASERDSTGEDPIARLTQSVLAAVAEFERHLIRQRLSAARKLKKLSGGYADGRPRFGFRAENASLVADEREQEAIILMRRLRSHGESFRDIATKLRENGIESRHGSKWHPFTVKRILSRKSSKPKSAKQVSGKLAQESSNQESALGR